MNNYFRDIVLIVKKSKILLIIGCIVFVVGFILGVVLKINEKIFIIHNDNVFLYYDKVFCTDKFELSLLISKCINALLILLVVLLFSLNRYTIYLNFVVLFYRAFILGVAGKLFMTQIAVTGVIMFAFLIFIQAIFMCASILLFIIIIYKNNYKFNDCLISLIVKTYVLSSVVALVGCIIEFLFIIMLFRPLNLCF